MSAGNTAPGTDTDRHRRVIRERTAAHGLPENRNEYETPRWLFADLDAEFSFDVDLFASDHNAKCDQFFTEQRSAFEHDWSWHSLRRTTAGLPAGRISAFMNPPYSQQLLGRSMRHAAQQSSMWATTVVALVPPSTSTAWWHHVVMRWASEVRFIEGRLSFEYNGQPVHGNRGDSCLVIFRPQVHGPQFTVMARPARERKSPSPRRR